MSTFLKVLLFVIALTGVPTGYVFYNAAVSPNNWVYKGHGHWANAGPHYAGAPGPVMGAGLPLLMAAGGVWLYQRFRRKKTDPGQTSDL